MPNSEKSQGSLKPDIEQIMKSIRVDLDSAASRTPEPDDQSRGPENNLYESIRLLNEGFAVAQPPSGGLKGWVRTLLFALLSPSFASITAFHASAVHALNKTTKLLDGSHDDLTGEVLQKTRNRMDLLEQINYRLTDVEARVARLEAQAGRVKSAEPGES